MKNQPLIVGLCGPKGAGKTEAAKAILKHFGQGAVRLPFAGPLKTMIAALGVDDAYINGDRKEEPCPALGGRTARHAMQRLGTEWGRDCMGADFWVDLWKHKAASHPAAVIVADDVRFANEARAIRELGGFTICVVRSIAAFQRAPEHASEDFRRVPCRHVVVNNRGLYDLGIEITGLITARRLARAA